VPSEVDCMRRPARAPPPPSGLRRGAGRCRVDSERSVRSGRVGAGSDARQGHSYALSAAPTSLATITPPPLGRPATSRQWDPFMGSRGARHLALQPAGMVLSGVPPDQFRHVFRHRRNGVRLVWARSAIPSLRPPHSSWCRDDHEPRNGPGGLAAELTVPIAKGDRYAVSTSGEVDRASVSFWDQLFLLDDCTFPPYSCSSCSTNDHPMVYARRSPFGAATAAAAVVPRSRSE
jgi:hypothetical protein